jgi:hypothetical protein
MDSISTAQTLNNIASSNYQTLLSQCNEEIASLEARMQGLRTRQTLLESKVRTAEPSAVDLTPQWH